MAGILQDLYGGCDVVFPTLGICNDKGLMRYETYYKMLDLYHQFSNRLGKEIDVRRLDAAREKTELSIMQALAKNKKEYINTCKYCGKTLPFGYEFRVCNACYADRGWIYKKWIPRYNFPILSIYW